MKRIYLLIAALMCTGIAVQAQEVSLGVKGGLTIPNITPGGTKTPLSEDYSSRLAWGAGAFADIQFTKTFSLQIGLEYSGQGGKKDGIQAVPVADVVSGFASQLPPGMEGYLPQLAQIMPSSGYLYADFDSDVKFNYLMLPVQAKFGWNLSPTSPFRFYVSAGVFGSYLLSAKREQRGSSSFYADKNRTTMTNYLGGIIGSGQITDPALLGILGMMGPAMDASQDMSRDQTITDEIKDFNFGLIGAIGFSYQMAPRHKIFIEGGGNYGLVKIQKSDVNGQNRIGAGSVMVGYSFTL